MKRKEWSYRCSDRPSPGYLAASPPRPHPGGREDLLHPYPLHHLAEPFAQQCVLPEVIEQLRDGIKDLFFSDQPVGLGADAEHPARPPAEEEAQSLRSNTDRTLWTDCNTVAAPDAGLPREEDLAAHDPDGSLPADLLARPAAFALIGKEGVPSPRYPDIVELNPCAVVRAPCNGDLQFPGEVASPVSLLDRPGEPLGVVTPVPADSALAGDDRPEGRPGAPGLYPGLPEPFCNLPRVPPVDAGEFHVEPGRHPDRTVPELLCDPGYRRHLRRGHHAGEDLPPDGDLSLLPEADDPRIPGLLYVGHIPAEWYGGIPG